MNQRNLVIIGASLVCALLWSIAPNRTEPGLRTTVESRSSRSVENLRTGWGLGNVIRTNRQTQYHYPGANVILITIDCLRQDRVGAYGYPRPVTPTLDRLAKQSKCFTHAYSQSGWTIPSIVSTMTSLYPSQHQVTSPEARLSSLIPTLAEVLQWHGYATIAIVGHLFFNPFYNFHRGFEQYDLSVLRYGDSHTTSTAQNLTTLACAALDKTSTPFFLWIHYFDPHFQYLKHPAFDFGDTPSDLFDSELAYTDRAIGDLLTMVARKGFFQNTVIFVLADHGEEFEEHNRAGHESSYEEVVAIPIIVFTPDQIGALRTERFVEQVDIAPTVLDMLSIKRPSEFIGVNMFDATSRKTASFVTRPAFWETPDFQVVITDPYKLIITTDKETITRELYNLQEDPMERQNLLATHGDLAASLEQQYQDHVPDMTITFESESLELSEEALAELQLLGYGR